MILRFIITLYFYEFIIIIVLIDFVISILALLFPLLKKYLHLALSASGRLYLFFSGCRLIMPNKDKFLAYINKNKSFLIVSNHQSIFDIFALYSILFPLQFKWIIKKSLFYLPFFGVLLKVMDYINIDRENKYKALKSIQKAINYIHKGVPILLFPEGTRSMADTIQEFKSGSLVIAIKTGVDIIPIVLKNTLNILNKKSLIINPLVIKAGILEPVKTRGLSRKDQANLLIEIRNRMLEKYKNL